MPYSVSDKRISTCSGALGRWRRSKKGVGSLLFSFSVWERLGKELYLEHLPVAVVVAVIFNSSWLEIYCLIFLRTCACGCFQLQ